jgi:hypothetical protein
MVVVGKVVSVEYENLRANAREYARGWNKLFEEARSAYLG